MRETCMRSRGALAVLLAAMLLAGLALVAGISPVAAAGTSISITPSSQTVNAGDTFTVNVDIESDQPITGAQCAVHWSPAANIQCTSVAKGADFASANWIPNTITIDNAAGLVPNATEGASSATFFGGSLPAGTHTFFTLTFQAASDGVVNVAIENAIILDANYLEIPGLQMNGGVVNVGQGSSMDVDYVVASKSEAMIQGTGDYTITYTIKNQGGLDASVVTKTYVYIDDMGSRLAEYDCPALAAGASNTLLVGPFTLSDGADTIRVCADGSNLIVEGNEANNCSTNQFAPANQAPGQPGNSSPADAATGVSLTPTLEASAFSDPDSGDTHAASQWQITAVAGDYTSPVFDSGSDGVHLTSTTASMLNHSTTYYWHVRYRDSNDAWSAWSTETSFTTTAATPANQAPGQPGNSSPADAATGVSLTPTLEASAFSDPDSGDTHAASQWQITAVAGDYTSPVFDSGSDGVHLTSTTASMLNHSTTYYWHVRYRDSNDAWSAWSTETSFTTAPNPVIAEVDPGSGKQGQSLSVTLNGSGFSGASEVSFGAGVTVGDFTIQSDSEIVVEISISGDAAKGARSVSVKTGAGIGTKADGFNVTSGKGGICGCGTSEASGLQSEMTMTLASLGVVLGAGYCFARRSKGKSQK